MLAYRVKLAAHLAQGTLRHAGDKLRHSIRANQSTPVGGPHREQIRHVDSRLDLDRAGECVEQFTAPVLTL